MVVADRVERGLHGLEVEPGFGARETARPSGRMAIGSSRNHLTQDVVAKNEIHAQLLTALRAVALCSSYFFESIAYLTMQPLNRQKFEKCVEILR